MSFQRVHLTTQGGEGPAGRREECFAAEMVETLARKEAALGRREPEA